VPDDAGLLPYLENLELERGQSILEASGDSYTMAARFSAVTGLPTAVGWHVHEWLWRKDSKMVFARADRVKRLYEASSDQLFCEVLNEFSAKYVVLGQQETDRYPSLQRERLDRLLIRRLTSGSSAVFEVPTNACGRG
jgi:uncharacterized membrane protein